MHKPILLLKFSFVLLALINFGANYCFSKTTETEITEKIVELHQNNLTLTAALSNLAVHSRIPIGYEANIGFSQSDPRADSNQYKLTVHFKGKLKDLLDLIIKQYPDFKWEVRDEVINFIPVNKRDDFIEKFLNTRIDNFTAKPESNFIEIRRSIFALPEIKSLLDAEQVYPRYVDLYSRGLTQPRGKELKVSDMTVRSVLNKSIKENWNNFWFVEQNGDSRKSIYLFF